MGGMKKITCLTLCTLFVLQSARAEKHKIMGAKIFDKSAPAEILFTMERTDELKANTAQVATSYKDPAGAVVVVEKSFSEKGVFKKYALEQKQIEATGEIEVVGNEIKFSYTKKGKTQTAVEKLVDNFVVPPTLVPYLQANWDKLIAGKTLDIRFGVVDRRETVGFDFKVQGEKEVNGKKLTVVKMRPSSFLIAAIVNPLFFYFDPEGPKLIQIEGRVPPKKKVGSAWKDLDALSVYSY